MTRCFLTAKMPDLDGFETTRRIRELCGGQLPVLIISATIGAMLKKDAKKAGVTGFLQKPIFVSTLIHGLQRYVLEGQPARKTQGTDTGARFTGRRFPAHRRQCNQSGGCQGNSWPTWALKWILQVTEPRGWRRSDAPGRFL